MDKEPLKTFENLMRLLSSEAKDGEELIRIWINLGLKLGVDIYFPHIKVVIHRDEESGKKDMIALIGSFSEEIVEELSSEEVLNESLVEDVLTKIHDFKAVLH